MSYNTKYEKRGFNCGSCWLEFLGKGLESGISRKIYTKKIYEILFSETNKIISISGVRRSGKSFILREVAKHLVEKFGAKNVLYINFEEVRLSFISDISRP